MPVIASLSAMLATLALAFERGIFVDPHDYLEMVAPWLAS